MSSSLLDRCLLNKRLLLTKSTMFEQMFRHFTKYFNFSGSGDANKNEELTIDKLVQDIKNNKYKKINFMVGAGISTCKLLFFGKNFKN